MRFRRSAVQATARNEVRATLRTVRRRWRLRVVLGGLAVVVLASAAILVVAAWAMNQARFEPWAVNALRIGAYAMIAGLVFFRVLRPLRKVLSDERVALYVEEREPASGGRLVTAAELLAGGDQERRSPGLTARVLEEAADACDRIERGRSVDRERMARSTGALAGAATLALAGALLLPGSLRRAAPFLVTPWQSGLESPYAIAVTPGDTTIARGADLLITARSSGFVTDAAEIVLQRGAAAEWERVPMVPAETGGAFEVMFFDVNEETAYFVEAAGVRSVVFTVSVADLPYVSQIALDYRFPRYTGLDPRHEDDAGDIVGPAGTEVTLTVTATVPVQAGVLVLDGRDTIALAVTSNGTLSGSLRIEQSGSYRIALRGATGPLVTASPDHVIDVLADAPPRVTVTAPGRDMQVTAIDEVFVGIEAQDDYGVVRAELVYSVNGGPDDTVVVHASRRARPTVAGGRTLFLEEFELEPGDVISYHARARDALGQWAASDIYFLEIRPFDRSYRQGDQAPGGMEGGVGGDMGALSQRQKEIVAATFKVVRDSADYSQAEYRSNLATLALAQGRLREEVETLAERMVSRGLTAVDSTLLQVAEALPRAAAAMKEAEDSLGRRLARGALPPEQQALRELQRAEAAFREWTVTRNEDGGGGGGGEVNPDELADLFELELDRARNQYEQLERGRRQQAERELDETLERVRELARRQQQENERARARAQRGEQTTGGGGGGAAQRQLAEEAEEVARRLERLSREQSRPDLAETARQLRDAAEAMRRAAPSGDASAQGARALERLREARRQLERSQGAGLRREAEDALRRAERLAGDQRDVQRAVDELPGDPSRAEERVRQLLDRKQQMADEVGSLADELDRLARESQRDQPDAAERLREASREMRNERLEDMIRYSRGVLRQGDRQVARNLDEQIGVQIDSLRQRISEAVGAMGEQREQRLDRALDETRDLANALEAWGERARDAADRAAAEGEGTAGESGDRQRRAEARARRGELERLRREFQREGVDVGALDRALGGMGRLDNQAAGPPRGLAELAAQLAQQLREFEFRVRRELAGANSPRFLGGSDEVPAGYRDLVEEYYRSLAERRRRQ